MADGVYEFRHCVPDGDVTVAGITPGEIMTRPYTFRCNDVPRIASLLDSGPLDPRNIIVGSDGQLFDQNGAFLAQVNTWSATIGFTNSDYNPAGQRITWAVPQNYTVTLTFEETVINDTQLLARVITGIRRGEARLALHFRGEIKAHNAADELLLPTG